MVAPRRILVKLRPATALGLLSTRANLRPLHQATATDSALGIAVGPTWYLADLPDGLGPNPWDLAHARVADQLGIAEDAVLFAEPDLAQSFPDTTDVPAGDRPFAACGACEATPQKTDFGRVAGPDQFAWHLGRTYSQLDAARDAVTFSEPYTRIAHIDTGYDRTHVACPGRILQDLERSFVDGDGEPSSAQDPGRGSAFPDNSGHGTGTIGILAGGLIPAQNVLLGGAPQAEILPLRISNSVVLFYTSAFAQALQYAVDQRCDVVSISMGGLPSRAWNESVNAAYESGICIVAAAGNSMAGFPTHHVVYPARYHRAIAACGVMANGAPYYNISLGAIEGNWGPDSCMTAALAAYTPNVPWAVFGCGSVIRLNGEGTSSATPQIAAAVALWLERYKNVLPKDWRRVEAVRDALFTSARAGDRTYFGNGILQAEAALAVAPRLDLPKTPPDSDSFAFLRVITGLGLTEPPPREAMFNLELTQRYLMNPALQAIVPDPAAPVSSDAIREFMEAVIEDAGASLALRRHVATRYPSISRGRSAPKAAPPEVVPAPRAACERAVKPSVPPYRRVRAYAVDPSLSARLKTALLNEVALKVRWEMVEPGPTGEYLEVVDMDASGVTYPGVDLNDPMLAAQDGFAAEEGNPGFHQQMVYGVTMMTIAFFERALGRPVLWRPRPNPVNPFDDSVFVRRLLVRPHALAEANAYYSPSEVALLFGYFQAGADDPSDHVPGSMVYTCLSHDIVAHEATHAILDGIHRRFNEPSNPDVLAFHEAFADLVALLQHFTIPEILEHEIRETRGNLEAESLLGSLAVQFGRAVGGRGALRDAIGTVDANGVWTRSRPNPSDYQRLLAPHARGALLVSAVFDSFLAIYETRVQDLLRIATGGTGVLPSGAIHPDLVHRLAAEAAKAAGHVLNMCIRALDYIPPVDITFGEYLRALITADADLVEDDPYNYRVAFVEAFRKRGIYPTDLETLSVDTLRWKGVDLSDVAVAYRVLVTRLKKYADRCLYLEDRKALFAETRKQRRILHEALKQIFARTPKLAARLGLDPDPTLGFEVHGLRRAMRTRPDGRQMPQVIVALTQTRPIEVPGAPAPQTFRGGSTLVVDLAKPEVKYAIVKRIDSPTREERTVAFLTEAFRDPLRALLVAPDGTEPFAVLHTLGDVGR